VTVQSGNSPCYKSDITTSTMYVVVITLYVISSLAEVVIGLITT